jgi:hypothetical protein
MTKQERNLKGMEKISETSRRFQEVSNKCKNNKKRTPDFKNRFFDFVIQWLLDNGGVSKWEEMFHDEAFLEFSYDYRFIKYELEDLCKQDILSKHTFSGGEMGVQGSYKVYSLKDGDECLRTLENFRKRYGYPL